MRDLKKCSKCGLEKPLSEFTFRNDRKIYIPYCKECARKYSNERNKKLRERNKNKFFVYKLLDDNLNILYVGKTVNFKRRMGQHLNTTNPFLTKEAVDEVRYISYICFDKRILSDFYEIYYINKHKPKYNKQYKYEDSADIGVKIREFEWVTVLIKEVVNLDNYKIKYSTDVVEVYIQNHKLAGKEVVQLDKETLIPIQVFETGTQASRETGIDDGTIYKALTKQRPNAGGYKWVKLSEWLDNNK